MSTGETIQIARWVERLKNGDDSALDELLIHFEARLIRLTRKMLKSFPSVARWEQTDDIFLQAAMRLRNALKDVTPRSTREFFGLAALQIRRELLNLTKTYQHRLTPSRVGPNCSEARSSSMAEPGQLVEVHEGPRELEAWTDFHDAADALPDEVREVFHLIWYVGLSQVEAASALGVSERTIRGRWQKARLAIHGALDGRLPGI